MQWMTNGNKYAIGFSRFLSLFGLGKEDKTYPKLHDGGLLEPEALYSCILVIRGLMLDT
jgi:hypothetical protein